MQTITLAASDISADGRYATISFDASITPYGDHDFYAQYPADAVHFTDASNAYHYCEFNETNLPLMAAYLDKDVNVFKFMNLCGVVTFTVSGDFDSYAFSGNKEETVAYKSFGVKRHVTDTYVKFKTGEMSTVNGDLVADGSTLNYIYLPWGANFEEGFSIKFKKNGSIVKEAKTLNPVNVRRNHILPLGDVTSRLADYVPEKHHTAITGAVDLGASETANCYIITSPGSYKIPVVKGNSNVSAGDRAKAKLLWETYNTTEEVEANSVIAAVDYDDDDNYVYFKTPGTLKPGNALIAALDENEEIIWSWHIWIPSTPIEDLADASFYNRKVMDRHLGALEPVADAAVAPALQTWGLYYQWGRKDPLFTSNWGRNASVALSFMGSSSSSAAVTTEESIKNPTTFFYSQVDGTYNWNKEELTNLWEDGGKTIYDPCPAGYRVPKHDDSFAMWKYNSADGWVSDAANGWFKYNSITFPYAGYASSSSLSYGGIRTVIWSATYKDVERGYAAYIRSDKEPIYNYHSYYKPYLGSVRCCLIDGVVEPEIVPEPQANITIDGDMSDWEEVSGASAGNHGMFKVASDDDNIYFYSWRNTGGRYSDIWAGGGYIYVAFDLDNDDTTGETLNGNGPYDIIFFFSPYAGTADSPAFADDPLTYGSGSDILPDSASLSNFNCKGTVTADGAYVEFSIPRSDIPAIPNTSVKIKARGNKDRSTVSINKLL